MISFRKIQLKFLSGKPSLTKLTLGFSLMMTSCLNGDVVNEYCSYIGYLKVDNATVLNPLYAAVSGTNTFCLVSMVSNTGSTYTLKAKLFGASDVTYQFPLRSGDRKPELGLDNSKGFIIGSSSLKSDNPYVFDAVCSNCYKEKRDSRYVLEFKTEHIVYCKTCKREYSLLNGGLVVSSNNGDKLFRYRATCSPTSIWVNN